MRIRLHAVDEVRVRRDAMTVPTELGYLDVSTEPDYPWCREAVEGVSRTFAITVETLEEPMAREICLGYLLCRIADTIEDAEHIPPEEQVTLLESYKNALTPESGTTIHDFRATAEPWIPARDDRNDDWDVVASSPTVVATYAALSPERRNAIRPPVREMVGGMRSFVERYAGTGGLRVQDREELYEYCHYVAGTVGTLVTNLVCPQSSQEPSVQELHATAGSFGRLLQLVNIAKDVHDDFADENNVYLPTEWLASEGIPPAQLLERSHRDGAVRVVERTVYEARSCLDAAQCYLENMPLRRGNTLAAWLIPYLLAVGTLRELEDRPGDALREVDVKVSREEVLAIMRAAQTANAGEIEELRRRVGSSPFQWQHATD